MRVTVIPCVVRRLVWTCRCVLLLAPDNAIVLTVITQQVYMCNVYTQIGTVLINSNYDVCQSCVLATSHPVGCCLQGQHAMRSPA